MQKIDYEKKYIDLSEKVESAFKKIFLIMGILFVIGFATGIVSIALLKSNSNRFNEIQNSRKSSILTSCNETNIRNINAVNILSEKLNQESKKLNSFEKEQLQNDKKFIILLIDSLDPVQNCKARVAKLTKP